MLIKKIVPLGLSIVISAGLLIPANALTPVNACQTGYQEQVKERTVRYKRYKPYKSTYYTKYYKPYTQEQILERLNTCMEYVEKAYSEGKISDDRYNRVKEYLTEKIEKLENENTQTSKPDTDTENQTPKPDTDAGNQTSKPDTGTDTNKPVETTNQGISEKEQQMVNLVNEARRENGLKPLIVDTKLTELARLKSKDMIDNNYFSHNSPTYGSPFDMLKNFGVSYLSAGENIAGNQTVERAHESLMNSPGHRRNILSSDYTHIGIGIQDGGKYGTMFTQMFIKK